MEWLKKLYEKVRSSQIMTRILSGAFWSFVGSATGRLIVLISGIIVARILTKQEYGELGMVRSTIHMFVIMGNAGLGLTAAKFISEYRKDHKERIPSIYFLTNVFAFVTGLAVTVIVLVFAPFLSEKVMKAPELVAPLRIGAVWLFITVINAAQAGTLTGFEDFKHIAINSFLGCVAESLFMIIGAKLGGVFGALLGYGTGFIVLYLCNFFSIRKVFRKEDIKPALNQFCRSDLKLLYKFSLPAALSSLLVTPAFWVVRTFLVRVSSFEELAIYEAAEQWRVIILFIPMSVSQVVLPILSSTVNEGMNKYWKVLKINLLLNLAVASSIALVVVFASPLIMSFYGDGYTNFWPMVFLGISTIFSTICNVVGHSISSRAKMWQGFSFNFIWAAIMVGLSYVFIVNRDMGANGLALAVLVAYFFHCINQSVYLAYNLKKAK